MSEESESDELNESELIELPFFLRALFDWLLDHHAVSRPICDNLRIQEDILSEVVPKIEYIIIHLHLKVDGSQARLRICLMLNRLLKLLGDDAEIDDALYQKIFDNMLERLKDKVAEIRAQAVTALQRLQVMYITE